MGESGENQHYKKDTGLERTNEHSTKYCPLSKRRHFSPPAVVNMGVWGGGEEKRGEKREKR